MGKLTELREYFKYFPDDVWRYRLAYQWNLLYWDIDLIGICACATGVLYPVLDKLIEFQCDCAGISVPAHRKPPALDPGFFKYDLAPVVETIRKSIRGELSAQHSTVATAFAAWNLRLRRSEQGAVP